MPVTHSLSWTSEPTLNDTDGTRPVVTIDVARLVATRLLAQANSGGGKSWLIRRLLEQTYGRVQHIVIDVEGEFHTLREQFDYVLAAPQGGDTAANLGTAALLARRVLELGVSIIIDIYDLGTKQATFVKLFLESLMSAPRELWHPVLVVVDEAHKFCPEKADAVSAPAVIDLMCRGRKRGFSGVLATQRLSKLDKDAAAEANNLLIGRTALDLDIARAAGVLGMSLRDAKATLPKLSAGEFFAVGPALSPSVERIYSGHIKTTHPEAGSRGALPTPPREAIRAVLDKLKDLPAEAEHEASTISELRHQVSELRHRAQNLEQLLQVQKDIAKVAASPVGGLQLENAKLAAQLDEARHFEKAYDELLDKVTNGLDVEISRLTDLRNEIPSKLEAAVVERWEPTRPAVDGEPFIDPREIHRILTTDESTDFGRMRPGVERAATRVDDGQDMPAMHRAFLTALAQHSRLTKRRLLVYAGYSRGGATSRAFADLHRNGLVYTTDGGEMQITDAGMAALGTYEPLPRGIHLRARIATELEPMQRAMFDVIVLAYPNAVSKQAILEATGYSRGGATSRAFAYLVARDYAVAHGAGQLCAAKELFE